jgi:hypothetical protein
MIWTTPAQWYRDLRFVPFCFSVRPQARNAGILMPCFNALIYPCLQAIALRHLRAITVSRFWVKPNGSVLNMEHRYFVAM